MTGQRSGQRLGQHFLANPGWRKRIFEALPRGAREAWVEIGAGHGEMTALLAGDAHRVIAIETDRPLAAGLRERASDWPGVEIVEGDVLALDIGKIAGGPFRVYGNLPYYISSPILQRLFECAGQISSIHIVIQLEVAARIAARPGCRDYGYLSTLCQFYAHPEIAFRIPPGAFQPPPRVTSALVQMTLPGERASLGIADEKPFLEFLSACFGQKRKTLRNNLRALASDERIHDALDASGLRRDSRGEQLSLAQFAAIFKLLL